MNILLWILQILLAIHTIVGAIWKLLHSAEQTMPSLKTIPLRVWQSMSAFEVLLALFLVIPAISEPLAFLAPVAAACIMVEMLAFSVLHLYSRRKKYGSMAYWLIVAALCAFIVYGRLALVPF